MENLKLETGRFYTITSPFNLDVFHSWVSLIPNLSTVLEPFAGSNNLVKMVNDAGYLFNWICFDILPGQNNFPDYEIIPQDTILSFPIGYSVAITNPPYLAKNSATRKKLAYPDTTYDNLYKLCLDIMLSRLDYLAAIVPESFILSNLFHNRLFAIASLPLKMFTDTDYPVCLSLFIPTSQKPSIFLKISDFYLYSLNTKIGLFSELPKLESSHSHDWKFNSPGGEIGVYCVDNTISESIQFVQGNSISQTIRPTSRGITRVSGLPASIPLTPFIQSCNQILSDYRKQTQDILLLPFRGLRKDGRYRRRLDFHTIKCIMNIAFSNLKDN